MGLAPLPTPSRLSSQFQSKRGGVVGGAIQVEDRFAFSGVRVLSGVGDRYVVSGCACGEWVCRHALSVVHMRYGVWCR